MRVEHAYPVPPRELFDVLVDERFLSERGARFGGTGSIRVERRQQGVVITTPRRLPLEHVPGAFRHLLGSGNVTQVDEWTDIDDGAARGKWRLSTPGVPVDISGHHEITSQADGSLYAVTVAVKVHLPLVGRRLAREIIGYLGVLVTKEQEFTAAHLPGHRRDTT